MATPHGAVTGIIKAAVSGVGGVGGIAMGILDKPFQMVGGIQGPHHIPGRAADGAVNSVNAAIGGVERALDQPTEQFGIPPDINIPIGGIPRLSRFAHPFGR